MHWSQQEAQNRDLLPQVADAIAWAAGGNYRTHLTS